MAGMRGETIAVCREQQRGRNKSFKKTFTFMNMDTANYVHIIQGKYNALQSAD